MWGESLGHAVADGTSSPRARWMVVSDHLRIATHTLVLNVGDTRGPFGAPVPKVIDFGIAKATNTELTQKTLFTEHRQMIGTPSSGGRRDQSGASGGGSRACRDVFQDASE